MPGPCNQKKKKKLQAKKEKRTQAKQAQAPSIQSPVAPLHSNVQQRSILTPSPSIVPAYNRDSPTVDDGRTDSLFRMQRYLATIEDSQDIPASLRSPCVEDFGDGPRVRDVKTFLSSKVAAPVSREDPLCVEFAQPEVLEMLCCVLPEETAIIAWYNITRMKSRVCPACKRLYHVGDPTLELTIHEDENPDSSMAEEQRHKRDESRKLRSEQLISGICSALCYFLVAHNYPGAIRSTFGRRAEDISDEVWDELDGPGAGAEDRMGFGMLLKMTRCHDMGLEQLILPGLTEPQTAQEESGESDDEEYDTDGEIAPAESTDLHVPPHIP